MSLCWENGRCSFVQPELGYLSPKFVRINSESVSGRGGAWAKMRGANVQGERDVNVSFV